METIKIEISFDLYKELTMLRSDPDETYDYVIRELLKLKSTKQSKTNSVQSLNKTKVSVSRESGWFYGKVFFPDGTIFRASYKGKQYQAEVNSGALSLNGRRFDSPSSAAGHITGNQVNGWKFWSCKRPNDLKWISIDSLRWHQ